MIVRVTYVQRGGVGEWEAEVRGLAPDGPRRKALAAKVLRQSVCNNHLVLGRR